MDWSLPAVLSTQGFDIDRLFWIILVITGIAFVAVEVGILWFSFKYRRREGRTARYTHGSKRLEILWTAVPALTLVVLGIYSGGVWTEIRSSDAFPSDALTLDVVAKQFEWNVTYPGTDGELGGGDDFTLRNQFHIPAGEPVVVRLQSEDVIHSFFIPQLRVKQDAVPGMTIPVWFEATEPGEFQIACAELCGLGHYRMRASVTIHPGDAYDGWVREQMAEASPGDGNANVASAGSEPAAGSDGSSGDSGRHSGGR